MYRLELIEQQDTELAHVFRVRLIVFQAPRKAARSYQKLPGRCVIAMRLLTRKRLAGNLLQQAFPDPNAGNREAAQIQIAAEGNEGNRRDSQYVGAIAAHAVK